MATLTVKVSESLGRSIAKVARRQRLTKSELIRRATKKYIEEAAPEKGFRSALELAGPLVGSVKGAPPDLSTNPKYLEGYGS